MASETLRAVYITALQNTHALEAQALQIMQRQVERIEHYPEMEQILRRHIEETHQQRERLEEAMSALGSSPSTLKEAVLGFMGNMAAIAHTPAQDEILKNTYANHAFENFEIAAYRSLLVIAEQSGFGGTAMTGFQQSLREEQTMAQQVADLIEPTTRRYLQLTEQGAGMGAKI